MLSNLTIAGVILSFATCLGLAIAAATVAYKYRGNAGGSLMAFILGFAAVMVSGAIAQFLVGIFGINQLIGSDSTGMIFLGFMLMAVIYAAVDFGICFYSLYYLNKTGIGKHKCLSLSGGYVCGSTMPQLMNLFFYIVYAFAIKNGNFITDAMKEQENYENALAFQQQFIDAPKAQYFAYAIQFLAISAVHFFVIMYMTRRWLEEEKVKSSIVAGGSILAFEVSRNLLNALSAKKVGVVSTADAYLILIVLYAVITAACVFACIRVFRNFPHGREKLLKSARQRAAEQQAKVTRTAWQNVNELTRKNAVTDDEDEEAEVTSSSAEADEETDPVTDEETEAENKF